MSHGPGTMQRLILDTLDEAKATIRHKSQYRGVAGDPFPPQYDRPGWVAHGGNVFVIPAHIYDMRVSLAFLLQRAGLSKQDYGPSQVLRVSFCRGVTGLIRSGYLKAPSLIPVEHVEEDECRKPRRIHYLADGIHVKGGTTGAICPERKVRAAWHHAGCPAPSGEQRARTVYE